MSVTIDQIEDALVTTIAAALTGEGGVKADIGTPESFIASDFNAFPLVLARFQSLEPYENMYPGNMVFSIYFIHEIGSSESHKKTNRQTLYSYMQLVFSALMGKTAGLALSGCFTLSGSRLYSEDDFMIYEQTWVCSET